MTSRADERAAAIKARLDADGNSTFWLELAMREREAARAGGATWDVFVREAERTIGQPWSMIRERINTEVRA